MLSEEGKRKSSRGGPLLEEIVPGVAVEVAEGECCVVERRLEDFWPGCEDFLSQYKYYLALGGARICQGELSQEMGVFLNGDPEKVIYLDIETGGRSGTSVFLIGLMHFTDGKFEIKQVFARDYSEEKAALVYSQDLVNSFDVLVTYNGKVFDIPFLAERARVSGLPFNLKPVHLDLLPEARKRWGGLIPDLRLSTLQVLIQGRKFRDALAKEKIPGIYDDFMKRKTLQRLPEVFRHNAFDLIAMAQLALSLICGDRLTQQAFEP